MLEANRTGAAGGEPDEVQRLRRAYEGSLSWRLTRPVRAAGRLARAVRSPRPANGTSEPDLPVRAGLDSWLEQFYGQRLAQIDAALAGGASEGRYELFRDLDDEVWALLLTQQYELYPNIRALLPSMPKPELQEAWNGASGLSLAGQSASFYSRLRASFERHGERPLSEASVLDFGCGWGRLTRYLSRDVTPGRLYGCDPVQEILEACRAQGIAATFAVSDFLPERLPFDGPFDLVFAFSVFTHLTEVAHEACLRALHQALRPGGLLIVTIRPPAWLWHSAPMRPLVDTLGPDVEAALAAPHYLCVPHFTDPQHPQAGADGQIHYGESVITMAYIRERWSAWFELLQTNLQLHDPHQVILTLRRR